jgi:hypothetical protein
VQLGAEEEEGQGNPALILWVPGAGCLSQELIRGEPMTCISSSIRQKAMNVITDFR